MSQKSLKDAKRALARGDFDAAKALFERAATAASSLAAQAAFGLGEIAEEEIRWHDAYEHYKRAYRLTDARDHLEAHARMTWRLAKGDEAVTAYEMLVEHVDDTEGSQSPNYSAALNNLALVVEEQGRFAEAECLFREALEIGRATLGEAHPDYAIRLGNLGGLLGQTGRVAEGRGMLEQSLAIFEAALPPDHPHIAQTERRLAALPDP